MQKDWEHYKLNKNGNPLPYKMHVKIGDTVKVIRGTDKGKVGSVKEVSPIFAGCRRKCRPGLLQQCAAPGSQPRCGRAFPASG